MHLGLHHSVTTLTHAFLFPETGISDSTCLTSLTCPSIPSSGRVCPSVPSSGRSLSSSATTSVPSSPEPRTSSTSTTVAAGARGSPRVRVRPELRRSDPASGRVRPPLLLPAFALLSSLEEDLPPRPWASLEELRALLSILSAAARPRPWLSGSSSCLSRWGATPGTLSRTELQRGRGEGRGLGDHPLPCSPTQNPTAVPLRVWAEPTDLQDRVGCSQRTWVRESRCHRTR